MNETATEPRRHSDDQPLVSLILCAYRDEATVEQSLRRFSQQDYPHFEIIIVDSSPTDKVEQVVRSQFKGTIYERASERLLPNEAHALGVHRAQGALLVFSDPGIYTPRSWLMALVDGWLQTGGPVCGSLDCHSDHWLDLGIHLAKFDLVLPSGAPRRTTIGPTSVLLCPRQIYDRIGGFHPGMWLSDTLFSWKLWEQGIEITFWPAAQAEHDHRSSRGRFLRERFTRGQEFGALRGSRRNWSRSRVALMALVTLLPIRLANLLVRTIGNAWPTQRRWRYLSSLPVAAIGHEAWLLGELSTYLRLLFQRRPSS